jgi:hypothetical protein
MTTRNNDARSLNEIAGKMSDADLNNVCGGDNKKPPAKPTPPTTPYMEIKMESVLVSSYQ